MYPRRAGRAIQPSEMDHSGAARESAGHPRRANDLGLHAHLGCRGIGMKHRVRSEQSDQSVHLTAASRMQKRFHNRTM